MIRHTDQIEAGVDGDEREWFGFLLNRAAMKIRQATAHALKPLELTPPMLRALETISRHQPLNQVALGKVVAMDRTTITQVVDHFEALGLVVRERDPDDRRAHSLAMTDKGEALLADAAKAARDVEDRFLASLSKEERAMLLAVLEKLGRHEDPCKEVFR